MSIYRRSLLLGPLALGLVFSGCEAITGPKDGQTRIILSQESGANASLAVTTEEAVAADQGGKPHTAVLALVEDLQVTITAVQALPDHFGVDPHDPANWETLTLAAPVTVNLLSLPADPDGLELINGDLPPGPYVRVRFLVSEANLKLLAPLTVGGHTFPAHEALPIWIPDPWVTVSGATFTVDPSAGAAIHVVFDPATSIGQLVVSSHGQLSFTPRFHRHGWFGNGADDDDHDHDHDDEDED